MSRYYLHLRTFDGDVVEDEEGSELASLAAAKHQAMLAMHEIVGDAIKRGEELRFETLVITDEDGKELAAVPLVAALPSIVVGLLKHPDRIVPMSKLQEYRREADECRAKAENAVDALDKASWLKLADSWLQMLPHNFAAGADLTGWPKASDEDSKASH